jgi:large subunit ribosomal protein L17
MHGKRFWQKKLNRSGKSRRALLSGLMTELVNHEQIQTTLAKAKFVKHSMEALVNTAKRGTERDIKHIQKRLFVPNFDTGA